MKGHVRQSTQADVDYLIDNLRPEDAQEVLASHGSTKAALQESFDVSEECWTIVVTETEEIAGMYGVLGIDDTVGMPWLLTAPPLKKVWRQFMRDSLTWINKVNKKYPLLTNACDAEYTVALNWLKYIGCVFIKRHDTWGVGNKPFLEFVRI